MNDDELVQFRVVIHSGQKVFKDTEPAPGQPWREVPIETGSVIKPKELAKEPPPEKWWYKFVGWIIRKE